MRAFQAIASEIWAITPEWLHIISAIALRQTDSPYLQLADQNPDSEARQMMRQPYFLGSAARTLPDGSGKAALVDGVAVIPVIGPIFPRASMMTEMSGATSISNLQMDLSAALNNDKVNSIVYAIDSPGGAVSGVAAFADAIYAARNMKPTAAHVSGTGASAAYWLATAAERISLDRTAQVGSIGVVVGVPKQTVPDKNGEMVVEIVSSNAPQKRPDPTTIEGFQEIRARLDAIEEQFVSDVARGRGVTADRVRSSFGKGGTVIGVDAVARKMADSCEPLDATLQRMARVGKASNNRQQAGR